MAKNVAAKFPLDLELQYKKIPWITEMNLGDHNFCRNPSPIEAYRLDGVWCHHGS